MIADEVAKKQELDEKISARLYQLKLGKGGIIFKDGSVIDNGPLYDHRTVLPYDKWQEYGVITYRIGERWDATIRTYGIPTPNQRQELRRLFDLWNTEMVYFSIYLPQSGKIIEKTGTLDVFSFMQLLNRLN